MQEALKQEILANLHEGKLRCATAWQIADRLGVERLAVGEMADGLDIRVSHCQLGLFGYGDKKLGLSKILKPVEVPDADLASAIRAAAHDGKVTCAQLFEIVHGLKRASVDVSSHAEALGIKIVQCQLGCF
jgi:hypothetical protein